MTAEHLPVKPLGKAFREVLETVGYTYGVHTPQEWATRNALNVAHGHATPKPAIVVRLGASLALDLSHAVLEAFNARGLDRALSAEHGRALVGVAAQALIAHSRVSSVAGVLRGEPIGNWYCSARPLGVHAWAARDLSLGPNDLRIDMVRDGEILRNVCPTNYSVAELRRSIAYYIQEADK